MMRTTKATREQFVFLSDQEVRHEPTSATFSTLPYVDPNDTAKRVTENRARVGEVLENGEEYGIDDVRSVAVNLLRERAFQRASQ